MATQEEELKVAEQTIEGSGLSRRDFLRNAGFVIGGASLGSLVLANACGGGTTQTVTQTVSGGGTTVTVTAPSTSAVQAAALANGAVLVHYIINGVDFYGAVQPYWTLLYVLREKMGFIAAKKGCDMGDCGVCAILVNDRLVNACIILAVEADNAKIVTLESLAPAQGTKLDALQQAWVDQDAMQCGFCTSGMIMTAKALLAFKPKPTLAEIKEFMAGTICRCGAYINIIKAIQQVAGTTS
jgi:aerobic-type carbon monoxide dehydrogenase small subunit (CoxS/CutS family)